MDILLADIGNTNTRLALADASGLRNDTLAGHTNANWNNFYEMLESYLREHSAPRIEACWFAVAGDVSEKTARLGIHNWNIDAASIERASGARRIEFIHDMQALGNSLPDVATIPICGTLDEHRNGQLLVFNLGTGFNTCSIRVEGGRATIYACGGGYMPAPVRDLLQAEIGDAVATVHTIGDYFSGRQAAVFAQAVAGTDLSHDEVMQSFCGGQAGRIYARALGLLARCLSHTHLPGHGIYFAGGMARSVLRSPAATAFIKEFQRDNGNNMVNSFNTPVSLIEDDAACLRGCLRYAWESALADKPLQNTKRG